MRHLRKGRKLNRTASHRKALLRKLASDLFQHKRIITTEAKAKELRPYAERLITKAKIALSRETQGLLADGQTVDVHSRRIVAKDIRNKEILQELFDTIAPAVEDRPGGYCRIVKLDFRRGDNAPKALIELVDWSAPQEGAVSNKPKKKSKPKAAPVKEEVIEKTDDIDDFSDVEIPTDEKEEVINDENVDNNTDETEVENNDSDAEVTDEADKTEESDEDKKKEE